MATDIDKTVRQSPRRTAESAIKSTQTKRQQKTGPTKRDIEQALKKVGGKFSQKKMRVFKQNIKNVEDEEKKEKETLSGPIFIILLSLLGLEDIIDTAFTFASGGAAAVIFAISSAILTGIMLIYLYLSGVRMGAKKMATTAVSLIVDIFGIPTNALNLIVIRIIEHNDLTKIASSKKSKLVKDLFKKK